MQADKLFMDRTEEFLSLARATNIPQNPSVRREDASVDTISAIEKDLNMLEVQINLSNTLEKELINRIEHLLSVLFDKSREAGTFTDIEKSIAKAMQRKHTSLMLRLSSLLSTHKSNEQKRAAQMQMEEERRTPNRGAGQRLYQDTRYAQREIQREEISTIRRREFESIEKHISELGRMVTEVSMHISLQGEKVEMIDGLFTQAKSNMRGGSYELRGALEQIRKKRRTIIVIFLVMFGILTIKYLRWI